MTVRTKLFICCALVLGSFLTGCVSKPSPEAVAVSRAKPFVAALKKYHSDEGDYPQQLNDLYPRYLGTNVLWYNNKDSERIWVLGYQRVDQNNYKFFLDSTPCSLAIFENGAYTAGYGPNYK